MYTVIGYDHRKCGQDSGGLCNAYPVFTQKFLGYGMCACDELDYIIPVDEFERAIARGERWARREEFCEFAANGVVKKSEDDEQVE